jgi:phospholipid/cholesterol/gamma-HCH transport system substrate-binding protein
VKRFRIEVGVAFFALVGGLSLAYLFFQLGEAQWRGDWGYTVYAEFPWAGGLGPGSPVEVAGVRVGRVESVELRDRQARVRLRVRADLEIQEDAIASIRTRGLIGEQYLTISLGASDRLVPPEGRIREVEAPIDLPDLLAAYMSAKKRGKASR